MKALLAIKTFSNSSIYVMEAATFKETKKSAIIFATLAGIL